jgi:hypothetical protein
MEAAVIRNNPVIDARHLIAMQDLLAVLKRLGGDAALHELNMRAQKLPRYVCSQVYFTKIIVYWTFSN